MQRTSGGRANSNIHGKLGDQSNQQVAEVPWEDKIFDTLDEFVNQRIAKWNIDLEEVAKIPPKGKIDQEDVTLTSSDGESDFSDSEVSYGDSSSDNDGKKKKISGSMRSEKVRKQPSKKTPKKVTAFAGALELQA